MRLGLYFPAHVEKNKLGKKKNFYLKKSSPPPKQMQHFWGGMDLKAELESFWPYLLQIGRFGRNFCSYMPILLDNYFLKILLFSIFLDRQSGGKQTN